MSEKILEMPRLGETMEEGQIVRWLKAPNESFVRGDTLLEIETDKTLTEVPALTSGKLVEILEAEGRTVSVGAPIARIYSEEHSPGHVGAPNVGATPTEGPPLLEAGPQAAPGVSHLHEARIRATPLARRIAHNAGLNLAELTGSGRRGRIEAADVRVLADQDGPSTLAPSSDPVRFFDHAGQKIAYFEAGRQDGQPILLLHGFGADHTAFAVLMASLARRGNRVVAPDLASHGQTSLSVETPDKLGTGLDRLALELGIGRNLHVVAHSLGAAAALALAGANAVSLSRLSLIAPVGIGYEIDTGFIKGLASARTPGELSHLLRRLSTREAILGTGALNALAAEVSRGRLRALADAVTGPTGQRLDLLPALREVVKRVRVKVIVGIEDRIVPWTQIAGLPPRVAIHVLTRSGHMPHWDQVEDVVDILSD